MSEDSIKLELDSIAASQKRAIGWLLGIAASILIAFVLAAATTLVKVERIDTVISERFTNIGQSMARIESALIANTDGLTKRVDAHEARIRDVELKIVELGRKP